MPNGSTIVLGDKKEGTYLTSLSVADVAATDENVITLGERYLSSMSTLVYECREKFDTVAPN